MFYKLQYRNWTLGRPKSYIKGPDVMSKSLCTQQRYASAFKDQTRLDTFIGTHSSIPQIRRVSDCSMSSMESGKLSTQHILFRLMKNNVTVFPLDPPFQNPRQLWARV